MNKKDTGGGDTNYYITLDPTFVLFIALAGLVGWLGLWAIGEALHRVDRKLREIEQTAGRIKQTVTDPVLLPYLIAIALLITVTALGILYLNKRFRPFDHIKNFFEDEDDLSW